MTILHVSDLHFDKRWFHWLSVFAPRHDVLVIAGDLLDHAHPAAPAKQAEPAKVIDLVSALQASLGEAPAEKKGAASKAKTKSTSKKRATAKKKPAAKKKEIA